MFDTLVLLVCVLFFLIVYLASVVHVSISYGLPPIPHRVWLLGERSHGGYAMLCYAMLCYTKLRSEVPRARGPSYV